MAEKICSTCRHWTDVSGRFNSVYDPLDPDTFEAMKFSFDVRQCKSPKLLFYERPIEDTGAAIIDGSMFHGELATAARFSCCNWERLD